MEEEPLSNTQEFRSFEWELVLQFEEGSLPPSAWSVGTLTDVANWYAKNLTREQATARFEKSFHRNRHRLTTRLGSAPVATDAIAAVDAAWESLLPRAFEAQSESLRPESANESGASA